MCGNLAFTPDVGVWIRRGQFLTMLLGMSLALMACDAARPLSPPEGLMVRALNSGRIELSWNAPRDTDQLRLAGYRIFRDSSSVPIASVSATMYRDTTVAPGERYHYEVRAFDATGSESIGSQSQAITTPQSAVPPSRPVDVVAVAGDRRAFVGWVAPNDGGEAIQSYTVVANPGALMATVTGRATSATITGLMNGSRYNFTVFALNRVGVSQSSAPSAVVVPEARPSRFPISHSANRRYVRDRFDTPFPILGRTAWFVLALSAADQEVFIADTLARGYNAVEMHVINHDPRGRHPPRNGNGELPFLRRLDGSTWDGELTYVDTRDAPDFTTPNPAYWKFVDAFLDYCNSNGILVLLFPAYVGYRGEEMGWMQEMVANGPSRMRFYGAWLASRYVNQPNIVWMMGGDYGRFFSTAEQDVERSLLAGLKSVAGQQSTQFSAEWESESIATDQVAFGPSMTLNGVYSWTGRVAKHGRFAYAHRPVRPAFLLEEPYDEEGPDGNRANPSATQPVRRFQWWGYLSTIAGYVSGNGYIWPFSHPEWKDHLDTQGSRDMSRLNAFVKSLRWWELVPSGLDGIGTLSVGSTKKADDPSYIAAAANPSGTLLVAYVPPHHVGDVAIDMTALSGPIQARWLNPTSAASIPIGVFLNRGTQAFTPPGNNGTGYSDWVLVLEKQ